MDAMTPEEALKALERPGWQWAVHSNHPSYAGPAFHIIGLRGFPARADVNLSDRRNLALAVEEARAAAKSAEWDPYADKAA